MRLFGVEPIVCINKFRTDSKEEIEILESFCRKQNTLYAISTAFTEGGLGCKELASLVVDQCDKGFKNYPIYSFQDSIETKIENIVKKIYGGDGVDFTSEARRSIALIEKLGFSGLPICMAKTPLSLSDDPKKLGRPTGFTCIVKRLELAAGAGYVIAHLGDIVSMPGLPEKPAAENIDIDEKGNITGLF